MNIFKVFSNPSYTKIRIPFPILDVYYFQWNNLIKPQIHDHPSGGCIMFLFKGKIIEELYNYRIQNIKTSEYRSPNLSYIHNQKGYHSINAMGNAKSIHFYYPKGHTTNFFKN